MAGMVLETNINNIMQCIQEQDRLANVSLSIAAPNHAQNTTTDFTGYLSSFIAPSK
jgi:hypothetical protein